MDNKDLKEFLKNGNATYSESTGDSSVNVSSSSENLGKDTKKTVAKYSRMNEKQLMQEMMKVANESKANGELTAEKLEEFYRQSAPMLTHAQRNKMRSIINSLK